ncbi:MAG: tetratricopeptide repeat protein [Bdellovibrionota bacterium]
MAGLSRKFLVAMALAVSFLPACAKKSEEPSGPERLQINTEFLSETLGEEGKAEGGGKRLSREEILRRRREREASQQQQQAKAEAPAPVKSPPPPPPPAGPLDPERGKLEELCKRCGFHLDEKDNDKALEEAQQLVLARPNSTDSHAVMGFIRRRRAEYDKAAESFATALEYDEKNEWAASNYGIALRYQGKLQAAAEHYDAFLKLNPKSCPVRFNAGVHYELYVGDKVRALLHYVEYAKNCPERREDVNNWISALAQDLQVERPPTPGYVSPEAQAAAEQAAAAAAGTPPAEGAAPPTEGAAAGAAIAAVVPEAQPAASGPKGPVVRYPFVVAKGQMDPALLERMNQAFLGSLTQSLAPGIELAAPERIAQVETEKGVTGDCGSAKCQLKVSAGLGAWTLVHAEAAQSKTAWYVIVDLYDFKVRKKARLKMKFPVEKGEEAFLERLQAMAKAVGKRLSK